MLTVLVSTVSNSQVHAKTTHTFFSKNISIYAILAYMLYDQSFNDTLTNDIVSYEQLGPVP